MKILELIAELDTYGADISSIRMRFCGDMELYKKCFCSFCIEESLDLLDDAIKYRDYDNAFFHAHTLKGLSGNLGLLPYYNIISILVESLRNKDYTNIDEKNERVNEELFVLKKIYEKSCRD